MPALIGGTIVVGVAVWFAFANPLTGPDDAPASRYVEAVVGAPAHVNPLFVYQNDVDRDLASLVFSGLTRLGPDGSVQPDLAQSWDESADGKSITFHLRPGVTWHTGARFTAADVLFTYQLLADPKLQGDPDQAALWQSAHCAAPDDLTVRCALPDAFAPFLAYATAGIVPKHILDNTDPAKLIDDPFNRAPIGTGPYRLAQLDDKHAVLNANDRYYAGIPQIGEIELRFYPNVASATADVVRHTADGLLTDLSATKADIDTLNAADGLQAYRSARSAYTILYLNNSLPPFNDEAVRRAIAHTINIDSIISDVIDGRAIRADSPIPRGTWAFDPDAQPYNRDVGEAKKILDSAGWTLQENAKIRTKSGQELRISLLTDQDELRGAVADAIATQLAGVGIQATVARKSSSSLVKDFLVPRQYQAAIFGWDPGPDPDPYPAWHSSQATGDGRNLAAFTDEQADQLMEQARRTYDPAQRKDLYRQFQKIFHDRAASIPLYHPLLTYYVSNDVKSVQLGVLFTSASRFRYVSKWTMEKSAAVR